MCGIIGYTGNGNALQNLIEGLTSLEYRGYDSAGVAFFTENKLRVVKARGRVSEIKAKLEAGNFPPVHCGIGHTRWATHGAPTDENSHPHGTDLVKIVHNGIIENYAELREDLTASGATFSSQTDTEVAALLIDRIYRRLGDPVATLREAEKELRGSYAFGVLFADREGELYGIRHDSPLIVGLGEGENFIASDVAAIIRRTKNYYRLDDGELAAVTPTSCVVYGADGKVIDKPVSVVTWDIEAAEKNGHPHFMHKEIFEEPEAIARTLSPRIRDGMPDFSGEEIDEARIANVSHIYAVACGTAMNACMIGKYVFEKFAGIPVDVEIASEFRYRDPIIRKDDLILILSQSGETADSLAALRLAKQKGAYTLAIVNVIGSTIAREADSALYTYAGPEIAVASTKAYTVQSSLLTLLSLRIGMLRGVTNAEVAREVTASIAGTLPKEIAKILAREADIKRVAQAIAKAEHIFCIGRGADHAIAVEGALKIKEISYSHAEAYAAGELKHGTISLIEPGTPVVALTSIPRLREKMISGIREVTSRGGFVYAIASENADDVRAVADEVFALPDFGEIVTPLLAVTVMQLLAYHVADTRGEDIDKPRNLAKSVTVE